MKKYFYLLGILSFTASCGTATYMYDDAYDAAEGKSLTEEGYTDLIKDNEKDHKVVVDKNEKVTYGGYYPSTSQSNRGTSFSPNNNCNCACGHNGYSNQWRYIQPGWTYGNPNSFWFNNCNCNHWNNPLSYHYSSFGNSYNLYGYYDYWGTWHGYYPLGMDPYGYYAYMYGWNPYQWNNNNGIFNGNFGGNDNITDNGNHFYGHRNPSSTSSSNTTVYAHTVKEDFLKPESAISNQTASNLPIDPVIADGSTSVLNKPGNTSVESTVASPPFIAVFNSEPTSVFQSPKPVSTHTDMLSDYSTLSPNTNTTYSGAGSTSATVSGVTNHVAASNQFEVKYPAGNASRTGSGQTGGTHAVDPSSNPSGTQNYYTPPVVTYSSGTSTTNSTSRSTSTSYNSTNTGSNTSNSSSGSNTTTSHRTSTTSTNSSSGSTTSSGGSRTTSTSRR